MNLKKNKKLVLVDNTQIAIVYRLSTPSAISLAKALTSWLRARGYKVFTAPEQKVIQGTKLLKSSAELSKMGLLVVLGGDGTYLRAVRLLKGQPVPILGINLGSLGFLTPTRADEAFTAVEHTLQNKMELRPRSMLQITIVKKKKKKIHLLALNDVVIERGSISHLINIEIKLDQTLVKEIKADGMIISSPTGSTAYNLAAGGPILHPDSNVMVVTPISPHSLTSRPTIFPDDKELSFKLIEKIEKQIAYVVVDGQKVDELTFDDEIFITRSSVDHFLIKDPEHDYFSLLREKLKFGDRE